MSKEEASYDEKPFSQSYVLRTTTKHMRKSVDISIRKTFERISEFTGNSERSNEVLTTLSNLHKIRAMIDEFQMQNKEIFSGE
jgi:DNA replication protein DnaD